MAVNSRKSDRGMLQNAVLSGCLLTLQSSVYEVIVTRRCRQVLRCCRQLQLQLEGAQRVHISANLHCLRPDINFKFHLCPESRIVYLYICVVIVAMTTQRYNLA